MKESELPEPIFRQETLHGVVVRVTLMNDQELRTRATDRDVATYFGIETWRQLTDVEVAISAYAFRNKTVNVSEASRLTGRTWQTSKKRFRSINEKGSSGIREGSL
jgi:ATP-dependent DNA helicase RecG